MSKLSFENIFTFNENVRDSFLIGHGDEFLVHTFALSRWEGVKLNKMVLNSLRFQQIFGSDTPRTSSWREYLQIFKINDAILQLFTTTFLLSMKFWRTLAKAKVALKMKMKAFNMADIIFIYAQNIVGLFYLYCAIPMAWQRMHTYGLMQLFMDILNPKKC